MANVSHEIRGPLASLWAMVEAMRDGLIPEQARERYLNAMMEKMGCLSRLTDDLMDLSKLDAGIVTFSRNQFDLGLLFEALEQMWRHRCVYAGIELHVDCLRLYITADYVRVEQVLSNFLDNAVNFTPRGGTIRMFANQEENRVRISVADTGMGIAAEHLPYIWERFYKVERARTPNPERGGGLGLTITRQLVIHMGGEVHVESTTGTGTVFSFTLPLA